MSSSPFSGALQAARRAKHLGFVAVKRGRRARTQAIDFLLRLRASLGDYAFDPERHRDVYGEFPRMYFLHRPAGVDPVPTTTPSRRVFCFWTAENAMSEGRRAALDAMEEGIGVPITLITPENLADWVVPGAPLHPAYDALSAVHRSDYLRAYVMWHHGGGYSDIKRPTSDWSGVWDAFDDPQVWLAGYPEVSSRSCGGDDHTRLGRDIHRNFSRLVGFGAFIMRPGTPFAGCQGPLSSAHRRPVFLPAGGHQNCPLVASWFARLGGGAGHRDGISSVA